MNDEPSLNSANAARGEATSPNPNQDVTLVDRLFGWLKPAPSVDLRTDLEDALANEQGPDGDFSPEERAMLRNILRLRETRTEDVMVQRGDIIAVDKSTSLGLVLAKLRTSGHSRMPVFDDSLDQPIGMVHIKDVVSYLIDKTQAEPKTKAQIARAKQRAEKAPTGQAAEHSAGQAESFAQFNLQDIDLDVRLCDISITRPLLFVPASMSATDLMAQMQANRVQMALVIDEYGGTDGLISLEDLVETVVGDIEDEHDDEVSPTLDPTGDGGYVADARVPLEEVQAVFTDIVVDADDAEDVETLGGLVFTALGRIPVRGELIDAVEGLDIEITDADPRRIKGLKIYPAGLRRRDPRGVRRPARAAHSDPQGAPDATPDTRSDATPDSTDAHQTDSALSANENQARSASGA